MHRKLFGGARAEVLPFWASCRNITVQEPSLPGNPCRAIFGHVQKYWFLEEIFTSAPRPSQTTFSRKVNGKGEGVLPPLNGQSVAENRNFVAKNSVFCPKNIVFGRIFGGFFLNGKGGGYSTLPLTDGPLPKKLTERGGTPLPPSRQFPGLGLLNPSLSVLSTLSTLITSQVPRPTSRERTPWALRAGNFTSEASSTENVD